MEKKEICENCWLLALKKNLKKRTEECEKCWLSLEMEKISVILCFVEGIFLIDRNPIVKPLFHDNYYYNKIVYKFL